MMIPLGILMDPIEELERIPDNRWNNNDLQKLQKLCKKISGVIKAKTENHEEWIKNYSLKNIRKEKDNDDSVDNDISKKS